MVASPASTSKSQAIFLAVASALVSAYLAVVALLTHAQGVWVALGAVLIVALCATFEALSERYEASER